MQEFSNTSITSKKQFFIDPIRTWIGRPPSTIRANIAQKKLLSPSRNPNEISLHASYPQREEGELRMEGRRIHGLSPLASEQMYLSVRPTRWQVNWVGCLPGESVPFGQELNQHRLTGRYQIAPFLEINLYRKERTIFRYERSLGNNYRCFVSNILLLKTVTNLRPIPVWNTSFGSNGNES